jgi:hypothetical protein
MLFGKLAFLDAPSEWLYAGDSGVLYLKTPNGSDPSGHTVEIKQRKYAFDLSGLSYIHLKGLRLFAAGVFSDRATSNCVIDGIDASYVSHDMISDQNPWHKGFLDSGIVLNGTSNTLRNSLIGYSSDNGVTLLGSGHTVHNNVIHDVNYSASDAAAINTGLAELGTVSENHEVSYNTMYNSGRGLFVHRNSTGLKFHHNVLYNAGIQMTDLGATYAFRTDGGGTELAYNKIHDTLSVGGNGGNGIYLDGGTTNYVVHHNVIWNELGGGIRLNTDSRNNKVFNNTVVTDGASLISWPKGDMSGTEIANNIFTNAFSPDPSSGQEPRIGVNLYRGTDPRFADPGGNRYQLLADSPAVDRGEMLPPYTDGYAGTAPDIGAYELGRANWTAGATGFAVPPASPVLYKPEPGYGSVDLRWGAVAEAEGFRVHYGTESGVYTHTIDVGKTTSYRVTGLPENANYFFAVSPYGGGLENGPSNERKVLTRGVRNAFDWTGSETFDAHNGVRSFESGIGGLENNDWVEYRQIDFGTAGARSFEINLAVPEQYAGQKVEIRLDAFNGPLIGTLTTSPTGSFSTYRLQRTSIANVKGIHTVYLVFKGTEGIGNITTFRFSESPLLPQNPVIDSIVERNGGVDLYWSGDSTAVGYKIRYGTQSGTYTTEIDVGTANSYNLSGLTNEQKHFFVIVAYNAEGTAQSAEVAATPSASIVSRHAWDKIEGENFDNMFGVNKTPTMIGSLDTGDWVQYNNVDFGAGVDGLVIRIAALSGGKKIDVRLDSHDKGKLIGTMTVQGTGSFNSFREQYIPVQGATGVHNVFLKFSGGFGVGNIDWFQFQDKTPPSTSLEWTGTKSGDWYVSPVTVKLVATDGASGVDVTEYSTDAGSSWNTYTGPVTITEEGEHTLSYRSTDRSGNREEVKSAAFRLDLTPPVVTVSGKTTYTVNESVYLFCTAADALSGVAVTNCGTLLLNAEAYQLAPGAHVAMAEAIDRAGNRTSVEHRFVVEVTFDGLAELTGRFVIQTGAPGAGGIAKALNGKLEHAETKAQNGDGQGARKHLEAYVHQVQAQRGKALTAEQADWLLLWAERLGESLPGGRAR